MSTHLLSVQFAYSEFALKRNTTGVTHEESLLQPQPGGNCMNWILGHILASRNHVLTLLGEAPIMPKQAADRYERGSAPMTDATEAYSFTRMLQHLDESQKLIQAALQNVDLRRLEEPAPFSPIGREDETVGSLLAALSFHEAYHTGQTGVARRLMNKPGVLT